VAAALTPKPASASLPPGVASRMAATRVLDAVLHKGHSLKAELAIALPALADPRDRALVEAIVFAALRQRARYDTALAAWMPKPLGQRDSALRALLHAGFAQLDALALPAHAAIAASGQSRRTVSSNHRGHADAGSPSGKPSRDARRSNALTSPAWCARPSTRAASTVDATAACAGSRNASSCANPTYSSARNSASRRPGGRGIHAVSAAS
jgi:hypothetical protein